MKTVSETPIAVIVLAAGASERLGQDKRLLRIEGETLLRRAARVAIEADVGPVLVVLKHNDSTAGELGDLPVRCVENPSAADGMGRSIRAGIVAAASMDVSAAIILLCDQLAVSAGHLRALADAYRSSGSRAVASRYAGAIGPPALFGREWFDRLEHLPPAGGAKALLAELGADLCTIELPGGERDIDHPDDLHRLA